METSPNFTPKAQQIISQSKTLAISLNTKEVTCDHLLLIILELNDPLIYKFFDTFNFSLEQVKNFVVSFSDIEQKTKEISSSKYDNSFNSTLTEAKEFSSEIGHSYVCLEHLFFALLNIKDGSLYSFFLAHNISPHKIAHSFIMLVKAQEKLLSQNIFTSFPANNLQPFPENTPKKENVLESFCVNFNQLYSDGKIGNIIGKHSEIDRVSEVLCRKNKNNPLLLGDPGVGKTAIIEGLASRIVDKVTSPLLFNKIIYGVDLSSMIAGTKYRGQFEQRIKSLISECKQNKQIILFVDEIHTIVGAGSAEGALDAANILKPSLARGDIKLIGATTFSEYKKNIEKDLALTRRFECIQVEEPSAKDTFEILKGIKKSYEKFHGIKYNINILKKIVELCDIYLPSKKFPDKAIDVLDDIGTKVKIRNLAPPAELESIESELYELMDSDPKSVSLEKENKLLSQYDNVMRSWEQKSPDKVSIDDVFNVVAEKAKLPKESLIQNKDKKVLNLSKVLKKDIVNQDNVVSCISRSILRAKIGLKEKHKPIGSFLFLGASGVGKTWSAKMLAKHYFGSEKNIFRLDMSEYSEKVSASKLIGASPGYVGYEEGGVLIEHMKKKPHCVLLFDEIEKSDPSVQQLLLQILEEGEIEDNFGTKVFFKDSIVILTSNIGSDLTVKSSLGFSPANDDISSKIKESAKKILSTELINRLDEIVTFNHLSTPDLKIIFEKTVKDLKLKLKSKKIIFNYDDKVSDFICEKAASEKMGARPLKRLIQSNIEDKIVDYYFKDNSDHPRNFFFYLKNNKICFKIEA